MSLNMRYDRPLMFHGPLLKMLNVEPRTSVMALHVLTELQGSLGVQFPASLVELLSIEGGAQFLSEYCEDQEMPPGELGEDIVTVWLNETQLAPEPSDADVYLRKCDRYMRFSTENQGVVAFYVKLDGSDDPPVFDNNDSWEAEYNAADFPYNLLSPSFSSFIVDRIAYGKFWNKDFLFSADDVFPNGSLMKALERDLILGPQTEHEGLRTVRLLVPNGAIFITERDREQQTAQWTMLANSEASAAALITKVWSCGILTETLRCEKAESAGDRLLKRMRAER